MKKRKLHCPHFKNLIKKKKKKKKKKKEEEKKALLNRTKLKPNASQQDV